MFYIRKKITTRVGVEPTTFRLTAECSNQLSYPVKCVPFGVFRTGIEPVTWGGLLNSKQCYNPPLYQLSYLKIYCYAIT